MTARRLAQQRRADRGLGSADEPTIAVASVERRQVRLQIILFHWTEPLPKADDPIRKDRDC
jgi:hypothetical protein